VEARKLPNRNQVKEVIKDLRCVMFAGYMEQEDCLQSNLDDYVAYKCSSAIHKLKKLIVTALECAEHGSSAREEVMERAEEISCRFASRLPALQELLLKDVQAGYDGDPAAKSKEEIIFCYPGFFAIFVYRIAHELYVSHVPSIPRMMTEYAHSGTGIDINPGATIGEYFFIDHGTGVVIGETTEIGNNVKLYQGVTLGALSTRKGQLLSNVKRHPTIGNNVTVYSNASILGGETVVGDNTTIGGGAFITSSVPANARINVGPTDTDENS
jgi:serine O-acetyltransferase